MPGYFDTQTLGEACVPNLTRSAALTQYEDAETFAVMVNCIEVDLTGRRLAADGTAANNPLNAAGNRGPPNGSEPSGFNPFLGKKKGDSDEERA